ncbi:MAG: hypothetical protein ACPGU6_03660 [Tenacibaculum sp.]
MKKALPYIYIIIGVFIIIGTFIQFFKNQESYRVLLSFRTENRYLFLIIRGLFAGWFLADGMKRLKQNQ